LICLPKRVARLPLPPVVIVDTRSDPRIGKGLSIGRAMHVAIQKALHDKGQVILFLNLRGFSPTLWCRSCGDGVKCPNCDITLTWHKDKQKALCHSCDYETPPPTSCPHCDQPGVRYFGTGTQRLEQEVRSCFPGAKVLRMDSDSMKQHGSHDVALEKFRHGEVQILLGTQMIAKGLDFPNVTLVGVIDADTILHQPDLRATERTFQLIAQVSGRTGRSERGGRVFVQTASPTEPSIVAAAHHDYLGFALPEIENRRSAMAPPFTKLARIILRGTNESLVREYAIQFATILTTAAQEADTKVSLLGPAPCPIARLKNKFRFHILLKAIEIEDLQQLWRTAVARLPKNADIDFVVDVDPMNMR
jgi:primosomal protein N' (replication factor Y)